MQNYQTQQMIKATTDIIAPIMMMAMGVGVAKPIMLQEGKNKIPPLSKKLTSREMESYQGIDWQASIGQYSNKGPIIILKDSKNNEFCRILIDTTTKKIRVLHNSKYKVADEIV